MSKKYKKKETWFEVSVPDEKYIREHIDELWDDKTEWERIMSHSILSEDFMREFMDKLDPAYLVFYQKVSKDFVREMMENQSGLFWRNLSSSDNINSSYYDEFKFDIHWTNLLDDKPNLISPEEVEKHFYDILDYTTEDESYDWELSILSKYPNLTDKFIEEHADWLDWTFIYTYQDLTEEFIEKWKDYIDWEAISSYQKLGDKFILKYKDKLDWWLLTKNQKIAPYIRKRLKSGYYQFMVKGEGRR